MGSKLTFYYFKNPKSSQTFTHWTFKYMLYLPIDDIAPPGQALILTLPTCMVNHGLSAVSRGGARRRPLAQQGVHTVSVAPDGGQGQRGPPCLVLLVHLGAPLLQQHLQGLGVTVICLQRTLQLSNCTAGWVCYSSCDEVMCLQKCVSGVYSYLRK